MNMLDRFSDWADIVVFPRGEVIFRELEPADYMYVILSGEVEVTLRGEPLGAELEGGVIGEMAMINDSTRSATTTTLSKVKAARVDRDQFRVDYLYEGLSGRQALRDLLPDGALPDPVDERPDDRQCDIGLQQGETDLPERVLDIGFGQASLAGDAPRRLGQPACQVLEHAAHSITESDEATSALEARPGGR